MFDRAELKAIAKAQIKGHIGTLFVCMLLVGLIVGTLVGALLAPGLLIGMIMIYLALAKGTAPQVTDIFKGLPVFGKALWLNIITGFFTCLWSMLLFVPGIIKGISYSMAPYVLAENPDMMAREALNESKRITQGHKMNLFVLSLSFLGWFLLVGITFGIAIVYVGPYMQATFANAYNAIKGLEQKQNADA